MVSAQSRIFGEAVPQPAFFNRTYGARAKHLVRFVFEDTHLFAAFPLRGREFPETVSGDERRVHSYDPSAEIPFIDHPLGANLFLEGRWRDLLCYPQEQSRHARPD